MEKKENILDVDISQLEIGETHMESFVNKRQNDKESVVETETCRRSSRNKVRPLETEKKRVILKPKRLSDGEIDKNVINYYLDKKIKRSTSSLETIFEHPKTDMYMSKRKYSRSLPAREITLPKHKNKVKKRGMKVKKGSKPKKLSMDLLLKKLAGIEVDNV